MGFPDKEEFEKFFCSVSVARNNRRYARFIYKFTVSSFKTPEEVLNCDLDNSTRISMIVVFLAFSLELNVNLNIQSLRIYNAEAIIRYFNLANDEFWDAFSTVVRGSGQRKNGFLIQIVKALMFLGKKNISEIVYEDYNKLYSRDYYYGHAKHLSFPTMLERVLDKINKRGMPQRVMSRKNNGPDYGLMSEQIKETIQAYLEEKYLQKGQQIKSPLFALRTFFNWLHSSFGEIKVITDVNTGHWEKYKEYITKKGVKPRTKEVMYNLTAICFEWLQENRILKERVVEYGDRWSEKYEVEPRMFTSREHYKKVVAEIIKFEPKDEYESLVKEYLLVVSATGLRASDVLWLGPGCIGDIKDGIGEIVVRVKDKTRIINKHTSIYPIGIEAIFRLESRLKSIESIKLFNKKSKIYVYCLFQYDGKLIGFDKIYSIYRMLIDKANLLDENGRKVDYMNVKLHALRHQKYNDIYDATGGSATAVKIDSGHKHIEMAKQYTKQEENKKRIAALKLIEEGRIFGKRADILRELLSSSISHERYVEVVKKMNLNSTLDITNNKNVIKYLGFGFCASNCNKVKKFCESCDFFYSCKTFESELKERYAKNFILIKSRTSIDEGNIKIFEDDRENIESLKYQEKWLLEIGVSNDEIYRLRKLYCECENNDVTK
jgi:integrase